MCGGWAGRGDRSGRTDAGSFQDRPTMERSGLGALLVSSSCSFAIARDNGRARGHRTHRLQAALRLLVPGTSAGSISPHFFQPVDINHDRALATSSGPLLSSFAGASLRQPLNQRPEDAASIFTGGA